MKAIKLAVFYATLALLPYSVYHGEWAATAACVLVLWLVDAELSNDWPTEEEE